MRKSQQAFTLIELMVTLAVIAVIVGVAVPSFNQALLSNKSVSIAEDITTELNWVRSEAVKRAARVTICASSNGTSCSTNWSDGFIAFVDSAASDSSATPVIALPADVVHVWTKKDPRTSIVVTSNGANVSFIRYNSLGNLARLSPTQKPIVIVSQLSGCKGDSARKVTIALSGLVTVAKDVCTL